MTSQRNLNGYWLGFQQSAAVPCVRQVPYQGSMGNCYGLLPLQTCRKPSWRRAPVRGAFAPWLLVWARTHAAHPKHPLIPSALQCDPRKDIE